MNRRVFLIGLATAAAVVLPISFIKPRPVLTWSKRLVGVGSKFPHMQLWANYNEYGEFQGCTEFNARTLSWSPYYPGVTYDAFIDRRNYEHLPDLRHGLQPREAVSTT